MSNVRMTKAKLVVLLESIVMDLEDIANNDDLRPTGPVVDRVLDLREITDELLFEAENEENLGDDN